MVAIRSLFESTLQPRRDGSSLRGRQRLSVTEGKLRRDETPSIEAKSNTEPIENSTAGPMASKSTSSSDVAIQSPSPSTSPTPDKHFDTPISRFIIAAGTIGAFTVICAILYVIWRVKRKRRSKSIQAPTMRRGTGTSAETQSNFEAYDYDAELKNAKSFDAESKFSERGFVRGVSVPQAAFIRRSSEIRTEPQKLARQSIQSQKTFYHAHTPSDSSQDEIDACLEPTPTPLSHPKERTRLNKGHRKESPSPLNLSQARPKKSSSNRFDSPPISPRTPRATRASHFSTATSTESTPRFQTVDTWVNHQAARLDREQTREDASKRIPEDPVPKVSEQYRQRREDNGGPVPETPSAFRYHPGRVVSWGGASLVPSEILDAKIGW